MPITNLLHRPANREIRAQLSRLSVALLVAKLCLFAAIPAMADTHSRLPTTPCDIRLVFGNDERGMPSVGYKLSLQIRNRTARDIAGVSVYWLDNDSVIIGNSAAVYGVKPMSAHLKAALVKQLFNKLVGPCYKSWVRPLGPTSLTTN